MPNSLKISYFDSGLVAIEGRVYRVPQKRREQWKFISFDSRLGDIEGCVCRVPQKERDSQFIESDIESTKDSYSQRWMQKKEV